MSITLRELRAEDEYVMRRMHAQLGLEGFSFLLAEGPWNMYCEQWLKKPVAYICQQTV